MNLVSSKLNINIPKYIYHDSNLGSSYHLSIDIKFIINETTRNHSEHDLWEINPTWPTGGAWPYMSCLTLNYFKGSYQYLAFFSYYVLIHGLIYCVEKGLIDIPRARTHDGKKSRVESGTRTCDLQAWIWQVFLLLVSSMTWRGSGE